MSKTSIAVLCLIAALAVILIAKNILPQKTPVYMIIEIQVKDAALYAQYVAQVPQVIKKYGGRYLARGGKVTAVAGSWHPERVIILAFDSFAQAKKCFESPQYLAIAPLREKSTIGRSILVDGIDR